MDISAFRFAQPEAFAWLFLVAGGALLYAYGFGEKRRAMRALGDEPLILAMSHEVNPRRQLLKAALVLAAALMFVLALARPQVGTKLRTVKRKGLDIVVCLDVSQSMLAEDVKPNRLTVAKQEFEALLQRLHDDRVGLVIFAGSSHLLCPLTLDYGAVRMFLELIDERAASSPGTYIGDAIRRAMQSFSGKRRRQKVILLLTDGEDQGSDPEAAVREAAEQGVRLYAIGIGTPLGGPIPIRDERGRLRSYKHDRSDNVVVTKANFSLLDKLARLTGGKFYPATPTQEEVERIYADLSRLERRTLRSRQFAHYEDLFQIPLALGLCLLCVEWLISERRRRR